MIKRTLLLVFILPILLLSCNKEKLPDNEDLKGYWLEASTLMDQEGLYFDGQDSLFYTHRPPSRYIEMETFIYRLSPDHKNLYLNSVTYPGGGETTHKVELNSKKDELTVWDLQIAGEKSTFKKQ
jgi:hypothetical protein